MLDLVTQNTKKFVGLINIIFIPVKYFVFLMVIRIAIIFMCQVWKTNYLTFKYIQFKKSTSRDLM
jgi:hypothetical protein